MNDKNPVTEVIKILLKWKKFILITTLGAIVISIAISLILPDYYKSSEIFYPYNLESLDPKNILSGQSSNVFGSGADLERLRQIGASNELIIHMVQKFNLYERYDIDVNSKNAKESVVKEFEKNYKIIKNDMGALELSVYDQNADKAAQMASEAVKFIDSLNKQPLIDHNKRLYEILHQTQEEELNDLATLDETIKNSETHKNFNGISIKSMIEAGQLNDIDIKVTDRLIHTLNIKTRASQIKKFLSGNFTTVFVIAKATPAFRKARPIRWIIVTVTAFLSFFMTLLAAVMIEFYQTNLKGILQNEH